MTPTIDYLEHATDVLARAESWWAQGLRVALVASVAIEGGTAREVGSLAVVNDRGQMAGYLSNGCIDRDIVHQGLGALETGGARLVRYGEGSPFRDLRLPCGGALTLLIDPNPDRAALGQALADLRARRETCLRHRHEGIDLSVVYAPKILLAMAGRGAVFRATAEVAHAAGMDVALLSPDRDDLDRIGALSSVPAQHLTTPDTPVTLSLDAHSAFLTLFHDHDWEPALLVAALATPARFVGALGSPRTQAQRLLTLEAMGVTAADRTRVTGPIGLVPGLRSAPLIAVSAVAQIAQVFPNRHRVIETGAARVPTPALS